MSAKHNIQEKNRNEYNWTDISRGKKDVFGRKQQDRLSALSIKCLFYLFNYLKSLVKLTLKFSLVKLRWFLQMFWQLINIAYYCTDISFSINCM